MKQTSGPFECVRLYDPAIDYPDGDGGTLSAEYAQYRDMSVLTFVNPSVALPIIFVCRRLSRDQRKWVTSAPDEAEARRRAFQFGVLHVKNYPRDGRLVTWEPRRKEENAPMSDDCLDDFGEDDVAEIGHVIKGQSFLALGAQLRLPPLASSQVAYMATRRQSAELKRASSTQTGAQ